MPLASQAMPAKSYLMPYLIAPSSPRGSLWTLTQTLSEGSISKLRLLV
jgi:hypothetical protein